MQSDTQQDCACHHQIPQLKSLMSTDEQRTLNADDERDDRTLEQPTPSCEAGIAFPRSLRRRSPRSWITGAQDSHVGEKTCSISAESTKSNNIICKLIESATIRCILFAIKKYLGELQRGKFLLEQGDKEKRELPPSTEEWSPGDIWRSVEKILNAAWRCPRLPERSPGRQVISLRKRMGRL